MYRVLGVTYLDVLVIDQHTFHIFEVIPKFIYGNFHTQYTPSSIIKMEPVIVDINVTCTLQVVLYSPDELIQYTLISRVQHELSQLHSVIVPVRDIIGNRKIE